VSFHPAHLLRLGVPAALIAATLVTLTSSSGSAAQPEPYRQPFASKHAAGPKFEPNAVVVKFKKKATTSARKAAVSKFKTTAEDSVTADVVKLTGDVPAPELLKKVKADPTVELASLNYVRKISAVPNDQFYNTEQSAYLNTARVPQAWDLSKSTGNQIVAVLDTGVDAGHPDLVGHLVPGYNVLSTNHLPVDDEGHGTMTLGIIAAAANNGIGVAGVGWSAKAMPVKVLDADGIGYDDQIAKGLDWAVAHGAKVINMSLGGPSYDEVLHDAVKAAVANGVVVVAAAGNDGSPVLQYPAAFPEVIAVAATDAGGGLVDFSSFGDWVDVAAPGWDIATTWPRGMTPPNNLPYTWCTGTSCSSPIVAGIAALVRNKYPTLTPAQVTARLKVLSRDAGPRGTDPYYGAGIVDAYAALGGRFTTDFAGGGADGNDQPARATKITSSASAAIDTEGDVDWYAVDSAAARNLTVSVTGPEFNEEDFSSNFGPVVDVYSDDLKSLGHAQNDYPPLDADDYPIWQALTAKAEVSALAGTTYIAVRNFNGSRIARQYTLSVTEGGSAGATAGTAYPIKDVSPADLSTGAVQAVKPTVTFARDVDAATVTASTVKLLNGKSGATIPAAVDYDAATRKATITPTAPLFDGTSYKIQGDGITEAGAPLASFRTVFSTADLVPQKLTTFVGSGAYLAANLSWTIPAMGDLDQVIVRRNVGSKAPTISTGTLVYAGTGSSVKNTGLAQGTTYTFAAWVKDRSGKVSPVSVKQLLGTKAGISTTSTLLNYGGSIILRGSALRIDNLAVAGLPVNLYVRAKNVSSFKLLAALKTSSTGSVSYAYKPAVSSVFMLVFAGNADWMGARTADIKVEVKPTITAVLSPTAILLGSKTRFSGVVTPAHYGKLVYLQAYSAGTWKTIASVKLSTTGGYAFGIKPTARGSFAYRVVFTADADHAQAITPNKIVKVS
jgi:serine protease